MQRLQHSLSLKQEMGLDFSLSSSSVNPLPAFGSSTVASDLVLTLHTVKLVVETELENKNQGISLFVFTEKLKTCHSNYESITTSSTMLIG